MRSRSKCFTKAETDNIFQNGIRSGFYNIAVPFFLYKSSTKRLHPSSKHFGGGKFEKCPLYLVEKMKASDAAGKLAAVEHSAPSL